MNIEVGLLFDGNQGHYNTQRVIELAKSYGMDVEEGYQDLAPDELQFLEDEAIDFLGGFAPEGCWVGYHDGDFGVWELDDDGF